MRVSYSPSLFRSRHVQKLLSLHTLRRCEGSVSTLPPSSDLYVPLGSHLPHRTSPSTVIQSAVGLLNNYVSSTRIAQKLPVPHPESPHLLREKCKGKSHRFKMRFKAENCIRWFLAPKIIIRRRRYTLSSVPVVLPLPFALFLILFVLFSC